MKALKLQYIGPLVLDMKSIEGLDNRQWNLLSPRLEGYDYGLGYPTISLPTLVKLGYVRQVSHV